MNKRILLTVTIAFIPIIILGILFPEKLFNRQDVSEKALYTKNPKADIVAFVRDGCPHCHEFALFAKEQNWIVDYKEITQENTAKEYENLRNHVPNLQQGTPTIILNGRVFLGYDSNETSGVGLQNIYTSCKEHTEGCLPYEEFLRSDKIAEVEIVQEGTCTEECEVDLNKYTLNLWGIGKIDLLDFSLAGLALLLGFLDGFNPCAMWVLITLLTLLINTHDMKKVWVIGGTFLFVSGTIYYLFIAAWLNVFLLIGFNAIVQAIIGIVAIGGGTFYLYEALSKNPNECKITNLSARQRTIARMKKVMEKTQWPAIIIGVTILAISVNMIELVCTAGLPAVFTQILALNDLSNLMRYWYIFLFIMMYMIDDFIIFTIAVYTLHATGLTTKYRRFTLIFGGCLMYGLGILLLFFPNALTIQF